MLINNNPTFLCIGVQKTGTSWLYQMVTQHPEVCVSNPKELHYFNRTPNYTKGFDWYLSHFTCDTQTRAIGEFTPDYFWGLEEHSPCMTDEEKPNVAERIAKALPDIKIIIILRNPVNRAVSSYYHQIGAGRLSSNINLSDVHDFCGIISMGYYADHLERWYNYYSPDKFHISIYEEDFAAENKLDTLRSIFSHIGVDTNFMPNGMEDRYNQRRSHFDYRLSGLPGKIQNIAKKYTPNVIKNNQIWNIPIKQDELEALKDHYNPHNKRLQKILGRKLPW